MTNSNKEQIRDSNEVNAKKLFLAVSCFIVLIQLRAQTFTNVSTSIPAITNARAQWFDANNDGKLDLFISGENTVGNLHTAVYINNGNNTFNTISLTALTDIAIDFGDYNSDGFIDLMTTGVNALGEKKTILYRNNNGNAFVAENFNLTNLSKGGIIWDDLDNDGDLDLIITGLDQSNQENTVLYEFKNNTYQFVVSNALPQVSNGQLISFDANNDGFKEVLITGLQADGNPISSIYTFNNHLESTVYSTNLEGTAFNSIAVGDYNTDGYVDIFIAGLAGDELLKSTQVWANNGINGFVSINNTLQDVSSASIKASDLNNDGLLDILLSGIDDNGLKYFKYCQNALNDVFTDINHGMPNLYNGDIALSDYDKDGDVDIFQIGDSDITFQANLFTSNQSQSLGNIAPGAPTNLQAETKDDSVSLNWDASVDDLTNTNGLSYNIYISRQPNGQDLVVSPESNIADGFRRKTTTSGNAGFIKSKSISRLAEGRYYWSVQAIDNGQQGSAFATEQSFAICNPISLGDDATICYEDVLHLEMGTTTDVVDWYSKADGLLVANSNTLDREIIDNDTIIVVLTKPYNCTVRDTVLIKMSPLPVVDLGNDTEICKGNEHTLQISTPHKTVNWYNPDQLLKANSDQYTYIVQNDETFIAKVWSNDNCVSSDTVLINLLQLPQLTLGPDREVCLKENTAFDLSGAPGTVNWSTTRKGNLLSNSFTYSHYVAEGDTIIAKLTDAKQCVNYDSVIVKPLGLPQIDLGPNKSICYNENTPLQIGGVWNTVKWYKPNEPVLASNVNNYQLNVLKKDTVIVEVADNKSCVNRDSIIVSVFQLPQFNIGRDTSICDQKSLLLKTGSGFQQVDWYSKKNGSLLQGNSWFFNYAVSETDTIIAKVLSTDGCLNYDSIRIEMNPLPDYTLGSDFSICKNKPVQLIVDGLWKEVNWYTNNDIKLKSNSTTYEFKAEESITIWSEVFSDKNCVTNDTIQVNVLSLPEFDLGEEQVYCYNDDVNLNVSIVGTTYQWTNTSNNILSSTREYNFKASASGTFFLLVTDQNQCQYLDSVLVNVNPLPLFVISGENEVCLKDNINLAIDFPNFKHVTWYTGDQTKLSEDKSSIVYLPIETTQVFASVEDANSCIDVRSHVVAVNPRPIADAGVDQLLCYGEQAVLGNENGSIGLIYQWSPSETLNSKDIAMPTAKPLTPTTYTVVVTNEKNCSSTDEVYIEVNPQIKVDAGADKPVCIGNEIMLGGNPTAQGSKFSYTYQWLSDNEVLSDNVANPIVKPGETTTYYVLVSSGKCSVEMGSITITVDPLPVVDIIERQSIGAGESRKLFASGGIKYEWSPKETLENFESAEPIASPLKTTIYTVTVTDDNTCSNTGSVEVLVQNQLFVPNLFSPNGDGKNDTFKLYGSGVEKLTLSVFDQLGNKVFSTNTVEGAFDSGWDGTDNGKFLSNGNYTWTLDGNYYNGEKVKFKEATSGIVKLIR